MNHFARLQLVGRVTYYIGWVALVCGGMVHWNIGRAVLQSMNLTQRNLLEASVVCFVICIATELRALVPVGSEMPSVVKRQVAA
jgi:hypothetical protein